jgi:hypothetical protein
MMKREGRAVIGMALWALAMTAAGCASSPAQTNRAESPIFSNAADRAFYYRQQANELSRMAERLEAEAQWYAAQGGQDAEQAKRARDIAANMRTAANEAEQKAQEYRRQVPHNQVF